MSTLFFEALTNRLFLNLSFTILVFNYAEEDFTCAQEDFNYAEDVFVCAEEDLTCEEGKFNCAQLNDKFA